MSFFVAEMTERTDFVSTEDHIGPWLTEWVSVDEVWETATSYSHWQQQAPEILAELAQALSAAGVEIETDDLNDLPHELDWDTLIEHDILQFGPITISPQLYGVHLTAPGYLDQTEWELFDDLREAEDRYDELRYEAEDDSEDAAWVEQVNDALADRLQVILDDYGQRYGARVTHRAFPEGPIVEELYSIYTPQGRIVRWAEDAGIEDPDELAEDELIDAAALVVLINSLTLREILPYLQQNLSFLARPAPTITVQTYPELFEALQREQSPEFFIPQKRQRPHPSKRFLFRNALDIPLGHFE